MKLVARLDGEVPEVMVTAFEQQGIGVNIGSRGAFFDLFLYEGSTRPVYYVPTQLREATIILHCIESGGKGAGTATVVCATGGFPLSPFRYKKDPMPNGQHAFFSSREELVTVTASGEGLVVAHHTVYTSVGRDQAEILTDELWRGLSADALDPKYVHFTKACEAAEAKLACKECMCVHYHDLRKHNYMKRRLNQGAAVR